MDLIDCAFRIEDLTHGYTTGIKFVFLSIFSFTMLVNRYQGEHISLGLGILPFEISLDLNLWIRKPEQLDGPQAQVGLQ